MGKLRRSCAWSAAIVLLVALFDGASVSQRLPLAVASTPATVFSAYVGPGDPVALNGVASALDHPITVASDCFDQRSWAGIDSDQWDISRWEGSGYQMIWGVPMLPSTAGVSLAAGATGAYNSHFALLAERLVAAGMGNSTLRLGWEFNQTSFPWYAAGQSSNFVNYWRQIVITMRSVPGTHFQFEWNPDRGDKGPKDRAMGNLAAYYPGDEYVDIIGLDVYDSEWNSYPGAAAEFQDMLTQPWGLNWLAGFGVAHSKPLALPELGLGGGPSAPGSGPIAGSGELSGGDNPTFIANMLAWVVKHDVANVVFWDYGVSSIESGHNPLTADSLRKGLSALSSIEASSGGATTGSQPGNVESSGYREVASDGGVFAFNAPFEGSAGGLHLNADIVGMAEDPVTGGYWLVASDGGVFAFNAPFEGSAGGLHLNADIVGIAATQSGKGYWLVASDGGVFAFGDARFVGSMGGSHLNANIVGMAASPDGGYWLVASDGGVFAFGDARFVGSMGGSHLNAPIVGMD